MPNAPKLKAQNWQQVKSKIYGRYKTIAACARAIGCTEEALRASTKGKCPRVAEKLEAALA